MLDSVLPYRDVLKRLGEEDPNYKHNPVDEEWENAKTICSFFKRFYDATILFCGSGYPTTHLFVKEISAIKKQLLGGVESTDYFLSSMSHKMLLKYEEYWSNLPATYDIALALDPRYKRKLLRFYLIQLHGNEMGIIRSDRSLALMQVLFDQYKSEMCPAVERASSDLAKPSNEEEEIQN